MASLFDPIQLGAISAPNRVLMAPLTRGRATREAVPTSIMAEYYAQRASAGLIITEATGITRQGLGWPYAPGLWNAAQAEAWKPVTEAVHRAGGRIIAQLWHMGRVVHPSLGGGVPVSASATTAPGHAHTYDGLQPHVQARALEVAEIPALLEDYRSAARNALAAGFDGVQIHAANGYLIDQFLRDGANQRTDAYGGSIENRIRLLREITQAVVEVVPPSRTAVRLSPNGASQGVDDSNPHALFPAAAKMLSQFGLAFLELREPDRKGTRGVSTVEPVAPAIRNAFDGPLVLNSDYDRAKAEAALADNVCDAVSFGRTFLANPDLPARLQRNAPLNPQDESTFYTQGPKGYTDYPALSGA